MKKNCRNCKHAGWYRDAANRKRYGNWAPCNADTSHIVKLLPANLLDETRRLTERRSIVFGNEELNCPSWEPESK